MGLTTLASRSRIEEFARLLDGAVAGPGAVTTSQAGLALRLRALTPAADGPRALRPEFRDALRTRLLAVAAVTPAAATAPTARTTSWTQGTTAQRRLGVTAGAMAGVIAVAGIGIASAHSLPGQPFYGLKRASEGIELSFTSGQAARGGMHLDLAGTRLREVAALSHGDGELSLAPLGTTHLQAAGGQAFGASLAQRVRSTLADMDRETRLGRDLLEASYRATGRTAPLQVLTTFTASQSAALNALLPDLPAGTDASAEQSLRLLTAINRDATALLLGTCTGACGAAPGTQPGPVPSGTDTDGVPSCNCSPTRDPNGPAAPVPPAPVPPGSVPTAGPTSGPVPTGTTDPSLAPLPGGAVLPGQDTTLAPLPSASLLTPLPTLLSPPPDLLSPLPVTPLP